MRKERDLNPRYPLGVCVLSRDVLSATQPSFLIQIELGLANILIVTTLFLQMHSIFDSDSKYKINLTE